MNHPSREFTQEIQMVPFIVMSSFMVLGTPQIFVCDAVN